MYSAADELSYPGNGTAATLHRRVLFLTKQSRQLLLQSWLSKELEWQIERIWKLKTLDYKENSHGVIEICERGRLYLGRKSSCKEFHIVGWLCKQGTPSVQCLILYATSTHKVAMEVENLNFQILLASFSPIHSLGYVPRIESLCSKRAP